MQDFRALEVWHESIDLAVAVYALTSRLPRPERFALGLQMRRASVSVSSNIAEGAGRNGPAEFAHFLSIAAGSASELDSQLHLAVRLGYSIPQRTLDEVEILRRRIVALRSRVLRS